MAAAAAAAADFVTESLAYKIRERGTENYEFLNFWGEKGDHHILVLRFCPEICWGLSIFDS